MTKEVAVIGCGQSAQTNTAYLCSRGYSVNMFEFPRFKENVKELMESGGIVSFGDVTGFMKPAMITTDREEASDGVDIILVFTVSMGHRLAALKCVALL